MSAVYHPIMRLNCMLKVAPAILITIKHVNSL